MNRPGMIVLGRCLAAMFGGYAFASAAAILIATLLPMTRAEAVWMGSILAVIFHVIVVPVKQVMKDVCESCYITCIQPRPENSEIIGLRRATTTKVSIGDITERERSPNTWQLQW